MKIFKVSIPEVHYQDVEIQADNETEAIELVKQGDGDILDNTLEYSHTCDNGEKYGTLRNYNQ